MRVIFHAVKKEALYHHLYETPQELEGILKEYIEFYNGYRPHRKLNVKTPIPCEAEFFSATEDKWEVPIFETRVTGVALVHSMAFLRIDQVLISRAYAM